jgi:predicted  nucleic acid-binding Zn-ribbon protein
MLKRCLFNRLQIGMIPLSYRESLTYEEQLLWLQKNLNEAIELLNKLKEDFDNIDLNFEELEQRINLVAESVSLMSERVSSLEENSATKEDLAGAIDTLDEELKALINEEYSILKEYVDTQDEDLQYQIDHFDIGNITLLDPTTGLQSSIQTVIDNIYDQTRTDGISAAEFDALQLTAEGFDEKEITAFNFDQHGKTLLSE